MSTSPVPQPQSNFTAQKGKALAAAIAEARWKTTTVKGTNMARSIKAELGYGGRNRAGRGAWERNALTNLAAGAVLL